MEFVNLLLEKQDGVATVTINRPAALNALNTETLGELEKSVTAQGSDPEVRVLIMTGAGAKAFVAGASWP